MSFAARISIAIVVIALAIGGFIVYRFNDADTGNKPAVLGDDGKAQNKKDKEDTGRVADQKLQSKDAGVSKADMLSGVTSTVAVTLKTSKGDIEMELYGDLFPKTVSNFVNLAKRDFYDGLIFHRVIEGFMIQGGDPTGTGRGGPGYTFEDELKPQSEPAQRGYKRGTVAMANSGPDTNGSQFFIMHKDRGLPYRYTIFGRVTNGMETVDAIAGVETNKQDRPRTEVTIEDVTIVR